MTIKVNWFIPVNHTDYNRMSASVWIRCLQLVPYLQQRGISCTVNNPENDADIVIFLRMHGEEAYHLAQNQKTKGKRVILDLVANCFDEAELPYLGKHVTREHFDDCMRMLSVADVVTCVSDFVAQRAREYHPWTESIPDSIDRRHFRFSKSPKDFHRPRLRAIWSGISAKSFELETILPLLRARGIDLIVITDKPPDFMKSRWFWRNGQPHWKFVRWKYEKFPEQIMSGEFCIAPRLLDNPYNMGHSIFKIGVFMAQGVPAIASPVPSYLPILADGSGGQLCNSEDEWAGTLDHMLENRHVLAEWSVHAQEMLRPYWTEVGVEKYVALFERLMDS